MRCISVESNGNVTLTWIASADTGSAFGGYHVYYSNLSVGPFTAVDSIFNYTTTTVTITGVNANNSALYFYVKTREGCCFQYSVSSDTLRTMRMIVTPLSNEAVRLNWTRIHNPPLLTTIPGFTVSKELSPGIFSSFANLTDTTTADTNYYCNKFINYRVTQNDISGCQSVSSIDGEIFRDTKGPAQVLLDTVSVDISTGNAIISWFPDSSADTQGYVIYQFNGISYDSVGTVSGINSTQFIYPLTNSSAVAETYSVAAFDSCRNLGPLGVNHKTMLLQNSFSKCEAREQLSWTPYINMNGGLARYEIWYRVNGGLWVSDGFVPPSVLTYNLQMTQSGANYEFAIRAVGSNGQTATSNIRDELADILQHPAFLYIRSASVTGSSVDVTCHVDPNSDITSYILYRGNNALGPFAEISSQNYTPSSSITLTDVFASADKQQRFYKITARDSCGMEFVTSNVAGTIFLMAEGGNDYVSDLSWTPYSGWQYPPGTYYIHRVLNGIMDPNPFASVNGDTVVFSEDVSQVANNFDNICYVVEASEDSVNIYGFSDNAFSNVACAPQAPSVYIPNAFTPGGKNPVFKPYVLFEDPQHYSLRVFNRWGQLVFESNIPALGWNGTFDQQDAPEGIYAYKLVFKGLNKKEVRRSGTVMLVR